MRGIKNIRPATFAGTKVDVGTLGEYIYCFGLVRFGARDGMWTKLEPVAGNTYRARLVGKTVESQLVFQSES